MSTTANDVTITGTLTDVDRCAGDGFVSTLVHPEAKVAVLFPAEVCDRYADLIVSGAHLTVAGDYCGIGIKAVTVKAAR